MDGWKASKGPQGGVAAPAAPVDDATAAGAAGEPRTQPLPQADASMWMRERPTQEMPPLPSEGDGGVPGGPRPSTAAESAPVTQVTGRDGAGRCEVRWHGVVIVILAAALAVVTVVGVGAAFAMERTIRQYADTIAQYNEAVEKFNDLEPELKKTLEHANGAADAYQQFKDDASQAGNDAAQSLSDAKQKLQDSIDKANQWLDSEEGRQTKESVRAGLKALLSAGQKVLDESGVTDPQTYRDAGDAIDQWLQKMGDDE